MITDEQVQAEVDAGNAVRIDFNDGYIVVQLFDRELFVLMIKFWRKLDWDALWVVLLKMAELANCNKVTAIARKGIYRTMRKYGAVHNNGQFEIVIGD